jgi:hypothetical protein
LAPWVGQPLEDLGDARRRHELALADEGQILADGKERLASENSKNRGSLRLTRTKPWLSDGVHGM